MPNTISDRRADAYLSKQFRYAAYNNEVMTVRQYIERSIAEGRVPVSHDTADAAKIERLESEINSLQRQGEPSGNNCYPPTTKYRALCAELAAGPRKQAYYLYDGDSYRSIGKIEYDYALTLPILQEDSDIAN